MTRLSAFQIARQIWHLVPDGFRTATRSSPALLRLKGLVPPGPADLHNDVYTRRYYADIDESTGKSAPIMVESIMRDLAPNTLLDVGCGTGALLVECRRAGVEARGLEYSQAGLRLCRSRGLDVRRFDLERDTLRSPAVPYDLVISTEVAEHLPASVADRFVDLLVSQAQTVVFTAATPGQGGNDHVNEQPHEYWIAKFSARGYGLDESLSRRWRLDWEGRVAPWFSQNLMIFRHPENRAAIRRLN
jgi:SAM-dependent methyltransferase